MINSLNVITPIDPTSTLLAYSLLPAPDPLQVDGPGSLTLTVSKSLNSPDGAITCSQIVVTLPEGKSADTLTPDATGIETQVPTDHKGNKLWSAQNDDGVITLTPTGTNAGQFLGSGVSFVFANFKVNHEPGTTTVSIDETASADSAPAPTVRTADILVPKFPAQFSLSDLTLIDPTTPDIPYGGSAELMWTGTGDGVSYSLEYQPADDGPVMSPAIGSQGPYTADNLTRTGSVTFTLTAKVTVAGKDSPAVVTRQLIVQIQTLSLNFTALPMRAPKNGVVCLSWSAPNARSCTLDPGNQSLPAEGKLYRVLGETTRFTMVALGADSKRIEQPQTVEVDSSMAPTGPGHEIQGDPGKDGDPGPDGVLNSSSPFGLFPGKGEQGKPGGDATVALTLPPLDLSSVPKAVIPITVIGGQGGRGGRGGHAAVGGDRWIARIDEVFGDAAGGDGGTGGNVNLNIVFDPAAGALSAQYIISMQGGSGGDVGAGGKPDLATGAPPGWPTAYPPWPWLAGKPGTRGAIFPPTFRDAT